MFRLGRCMKWAYFERFSCKSARIHFPSHTNLISKRDAFPEITRSLNLVSVQSRLEKRMAIHIAASEAEWKKPGSYDEFTQRALEEAIELEHSLVPTAVAPVGSMAIGSLFTCFRYALACS